MLLDEENTGEPQAMRFLGQNARVVESRSSLL